MLNRVLVTGGAGFIGSHLVEFLLAKTRAEILVIDALTYAGDRDFISNLSSEGSLRFEQADVADRARMAELVGDFAPDAIMHLAAESHVDRSIDGADAFVRANALGAQSMLDAARGYWMGLGEDRRAGFRYLHVSTDEVFGALEGEGVFDERSPYKPNSPYAASKAAGDFLVRAAHRTYGLPTLTTYGCNTLGPRQFPEKLLPVMSLAAVDGRPMPVYGRGAQVRDWIHVRDHVRALWRVLEAGTVGETYCISAGEERSNLQIVEDICAIADELFPDSPHRPHRNLITFVADRPGHDFRYATDATKLRTTLGWTPEIAFEAGLRETVEWFAHNRAYCARRLGGADVTTRRGGGG